MNSIPFRGRWTIAICHIASVLLAAGCSSPSAGVAPTTPAAATATPNFGPPMQDVRTEATVQAIEQEYNAAKNSRPTHQYEAELEAAKKAKAKREQDAAAAKAAEKPEPAATP